MDAKPLFIVGLSGNSLVCGEIALEAGYSPIYVISNKGYEKFLPKVGRDRTIADLHQFAEQAAGMNRVDCFCAIGDLQKRSIDFTTIQDLKIPGLQFVNLLHPTATIHDSSQLGENIQVGAHAVIGVGAHVSNCTVINTGSILEHDCQMGEFSHLAPGTTVGGETTIGRFVWIGIGSTILNRISICDNAYIGAGSNVVKNIVEPGKYFGNPARSQPQ